MVGVRVYQSGSVLYGAITPPTPPHFSQKQSGSWIHSRMNDVTP